MNSSGEVALAVGRVTYRGRTSGIEQTQLLGWTFRFRDGRLERLRAFRNPEEVFGTMLEPS
jgi:ketosteroid isomerase-like protein